MLLQYRKRYELLQPVLCNSCMHLKKHGYNTASGMSCCNLRAVSSDTFKDDPLQYRKRYELLQPEGSTTLPEGFSIRLQYRKRYELLQLLITLLDLGVLFRYNTASGMSCCNSLSAI